ncbi:MAG: hypothetical protein LBS62_06225 [Clostridiales bacterium]|nr:hypothetical protein [Clostridiales bacterium]
MAVVVHSRKSSRKTRGRKSVILFLPPTLSECFTEITFPRHRLEIGCDGRLGNAAPGLNMVG